MKRMCALIHQTKVLDGMRRLTVGLAEQKNRAGKRRGCFICYRFFSIQWTVVSPLVALPDSRAAVPSASPFYWTSPRKLTTLARRKTYAHSNPVGFSARSFLERVPVAALMWAFGTKAFKFNPSVWYFPLPLVCRCGLHAKCAMSPGVRSTFSIASLLVMFTLPLSVFHFCYFSFLLSFFCLVFNVFSLKSTTVKKRKYAFN